jgi:hypothetical protein
MPWTGDDRPPGTFGYQGAERAGALTQLIVKFLTVQWCRKSGVAVMAQELSAPCPKCHGEMIYVTALPHPKAPQMQKTTFVCYNCNQTRTYSLSLEMAEAYAIVAAPAAPI